MSETRVPMRPLLYASLALNVLVLGGAIGAYAAGVRLEPPGAQRSVEAAGAQRGGFMRALNPASRVKLRRELVGLWINTRDLRLRARAAREEVARLATADAYDAAAVSAALARMREANAALQAAWHDRVAQALAALSPEERRAAVAALLRERGRMVQRALQGAGGALDEAPTQEK